MLVNIVQQHGSVHVWFFPFSHLFTGKNHLIEEEMATFIKSFIRPSKRFEWRIEKENMRTDCLAIPNIHMLRTIAS